MMFTIVAIIAIATLANAQRVQNNYNHNYYNRPNTPQPVGFSGAPCPQPNGTFATGTCDAYIECKNGVGEEKLCPDGLLFNPETHGFPCQYPIDVDCTGRTSTQPPQPTEDCPRQYGYYRMGDGSHCGQFLNCAAGRGFLFDCPEGLAFNAETYRCDWPDQVPDCDAEAFLRFSCPPPPRSFFGEEFRFFRSSNDCQEYFVCIDGKPRKYRCGENDAFNELTNTCDHLENVVGCSLNSNVVQNDRHRG